jgi:hypothetical protein
MVEAFEAAKERIARIRFLGDQQDKQKSTLPSDDGAINARFYRDGVELSPQLTPALWNALEKVCQALALPPDVVAAFVYASPAVEASCHNISGRKIYSRFSSGLVDLLDEDEFAFVAGHELGHYLFDHHASSLETESPGFYRQSRAQEISVDRVGLLACGSLQVALRALMKTVSGLTSRHMRFDVGAFIDQIRRVGNNDMSSLADTHPPILVRSRALLWFSMSDAYKRWPDEARTQDLDKVDRLIERDLEQYVDGALKREADDLRKAVLLWGIVTHILQTESFSKLAQTKLAALFDEATVEGLRNFLLGAPRPALRSLVAEKLSSARRALNSYGTSPGSVTALDNEAAQVAAEILRAPQAQR